MSLEVWSVTSGPTGLTLLILNGFFPGLGPENNIERPKMKQYRRNKPIKIEGFWTKYSKKFIIPTSIPIVEIVLKGRKSHDNRGTANTEIKVYNREQQR